jgi:sporulation protein YlmC with PRC-barrel domain
VRAGFQLMLLVAATLSICLPVTRDPLWAAEPPPPAPQSPPTDQAAPGAQAPAPNPPAAPAAPAPSEAAPPTASTGTPATVLDDQQVTAILGKSVRGRNGEDMGRIVDVIVNRDGQVRAAVIDFGGFLGVGSRRIAVDWSALRFEPSGKPDRISVDLSRNSVRLAPEYKEGSPVVVLGPELPPPVATAPAKDAAKEK